MCVSSKLDNIRSFDAQDDKSEGVCPQFLIIARIETLQWTGVKIAQEFVKLFNAEIENFYASKIPARRPNSMNNYGSQAKKRGVWCMSTSLGEEKVLITPILFILIGGLEHFLFFYILGIIIPTDFHIFQRG